MSSVSGIESYMDGVTDTQLNKDGNMLGKDAFLKLLVTQISNQDPTEPMDNRDLVLQLSQFSTLESTQQLNSNMEAYIEMASLATATSLIGKDVVYLDSESGEDFIGTVSSVKKSTDGYVLNIGSDEIPFDNIRYVYNSGTLQSASSETDSETSE